MSPFPEKDIGCHRTGFEKTCFQCVTEHRCRLWQHIIGTDPQTGVGFDFYGCVDEFRTKLYLEMSQQMRQAGASADKVASEVRLFHQKMESMNLQQIHRQKMDGLIEGPK